ncbi:DUF6057 family protein [Parabacteroides sp. PF5-6]|uniref:DUF6057 family protein n=1 Tax=Parabacteroides sp. PF5-6 TaxID=1742403 RepID=UPI002406B019|nr:DUF6057 family protein [Parabacteroides sp. PF5-6]MDF9830135.1 hypothetical protein [Parabacteroides sp. PF5-6]
MKENLKYQIGFLVIVYHLWCFVYPETLGSIEANSFFVWTPDYRAMKLSRLGGIVSLIADYLSQFYRWREVGALMQTAFLALFLSLFDYLFYWLNNGQNAWIFFLPASLFLFMQLYTPSLLLPVYCVLGTALFVLIVLFVCRSAGRVIKPIKVPPALPYVYALLILFTVILVFVFCPSTRQREKLIGIEQAAIASQWNYVLNRITPEEALYNPNLQRYVLLALSEQGRLADHLFKLNPASEECFYFYRATTPPARLFNSLFYKNLGIYNESVHQLFEMAIQTRNGMTFQCLRQLIDSYLKMGNVALADKYLTILQHATCHKRWVENRGKLLQALRQSPIDTPVKSRNDIFIGAYPFLKEMALLLEENPENLKIQTYYQSALSIRKAASTSSRIGGSVSP